MDLGHAESLHGFIATKSSDALRSPESCLAKLKGKEVAKTFLKWLDMAMKRVKIAELKDHLSAHLRAVEQGAEIVVTDRNRPIAHLVPCRGPSRTPVLRPAERPFSEVRARRYRPAKWPVPSIELLREERGER